jgi:hypothetical protein
VTEKAMWRPSIGRPSRSTPGSSRNEPRAGKGLPLSGVERDDGVKGGLVADFGTTMAAKLFDGRSKAGERIVNVHLSEAECAKLFQAAYECGVKVGFKLAGKVREEDEE